MFPFGCFQVCYILEVLWAACRRPLFDSWVENVPWRRDRLPTPVFWPREFHGLYSPWGCKELDMSDWEKKKKKGLVNHFKTDNFILEYIGFISSSPTGSSRHSKHPSSSLSLTRPSWLIDKVFHPS